MIRAPSRGEALRASWGAAVSEGVNALAPMAAPGSLARQGVAGTGAQALPQNRRERRAAGGASPDAFRVRACVESRREGGAAERRLVVEMLSSGADMVTWNDRTVDARGVEPGGGLSPAADCNVGRPGWQRIHEGEWAGEESFGGDIEVWLRLHLAFDPATDDGYGLEDNAGWTLAAAAGDDAKWTVPATDGVGTRELVRYILVAKVAGGAVVCQGLLGSLHFAEMYPAAGGSGGGLSEGDVEGLLGRKCVTSLTGDKAGSLPVKGAVAVSAARTGLKVGTGVVKEAGEDGSETEVASMRVEVEGLGDDEAVALRAVKDGETGETVARVMGTADVELPAVGVASLNGATGDVSVIGGKNIEVTTDGRTVRISYSADKEGEDDDPNGGDPCDHDGIGGAGGGVLAGGDGSGGGVPADGDTHPGDDNCNCD